VACASAAPTKSPPPPTFRFAKAVSDGMILQSAPKPAMVWGFCDTDAKVSVSFNGKSIDATVGPDQATGSMTTWRALLPATPASFDLHSLTATSAGVTLTLRDVMFGDVWVCSGQSNMQYPIGTPTCWNETNINCTVKDAQCAYGCANQSGTEIAAMAAYDKGMRLLIDEGFSRGFKDPYPDMLGSTGWLAPSKMGGKFSATCWFYGRDIYTKLTPPRPIGLIGAYVGGTPDQHWSSPDAIDQCKGPSKWDWPSNFKDSALWNAFIVPLLRTVHSGAIWYQGEANAGTDGRQYNCSFPAMIKDWRAKWHNYTDGATSLEFPFGWAQLNSDNSLPAYTNPKSAGAAYGEFGQWEAGFPSIRLAQTATLALPNTFQAIIVDTPVASGSVHSPYKQPVGARLARGGLAVAYGMTDLNKVNPVATSASLQGGSVVVKLLGLGSKVLATPKALGFEVLGADQVWHSTPIESSAEDSVTVGTAPTGALAVRYLYYKAPCSEQPYQCAVYTDVAPLGTLSGEEQDFLPLAPFVMKLSSTPQLEESKPALL